MGALVSPPFASFFLPRLEPFLSRLTQDIPGHRKLRAGMVGGGKGAFFAGIHRAAMRLSNRFDLVAGAFSSNDQSAREAGEALGVSSERIYASYSEMAKAEAARPDPIEVAIIVTPNHLHYAACRAFLEAGIAVICDKPLCNDVAEAQELVRLSDETGLFFGVTYTYTGYPMVRDARARIASGEIGEIRMVYAEYLLDWLAQDPAKLGKGGSWRSDPAKAGPTGCLGDIGTHAFNMLEFVTGLRCTALNAKLNRTVPEFGLDDTDMLMLEFGPAVSGLLWSSLAAPGHRNGLKFKIVGTKGTLEWHQEAPETLSLYRLDAADLTYRRGQSDNSADALDARSLPAGNPESYFEALAVLYGDYADALLAGRDWRTASRVPITDVREGLRGVLLSEICLASSDRRAWVEFPAA